MDQSKPWGFIVFMYDGYYPGGGENDIKGVFETVKDACYFVMSFENPPNEYADVYDISSRKTVAEFSAPYGTVRSGIFGRRWESMTIPTEVAFTKAE